MDPLIDQFVDNSCVSRLDCSTHRIMEGSKLPCASSSEFREVQCNNATDSARHVQEKIWYICTVCQHACLSLDLLVVHKKQVHGSASRASWRINQDDLSPITAVKRIEDARKALQNLLKPTRSVIRIKPIKTLIEESEDEERSTLDPDIESDVAKASETNEEVADIRTVSSNKENKKTESAKRDKVSAADKTCPICEKTLKWGKDMKSHMVSHSEERPVACSECDKRFKNVKLMKQHQKAIHRKEAKFECRECHEKFTLISVLKTHYLLHSGRTLYPCDICGRNFDRRINMVAHKLTHEARPSVSAVDQNEGNNISIPNDNDLQRIEGVRPAALSQCNIPFSCAECGKKFKNASLMKVHQDTSHRSGASFASTETETNLDSNVVIMTDVESKRKANSGRQCKGKMDSTGNRNYGYICSPGLSNDDDYSCLYSECGFEYEDTETNIEDHNTPFLGNPEYGNLSLQVKEEVTEELNNSSIEHDDIMQSLDSWQPSPCVASPGTSNPSSPQVLGDVPVPTENENSVELSESKKFGKTLRTRIVKIEPKELTDRSPSEEDSSSNFSHHGNGDIDYTLSEDELPQTKMKKRVRRSKKRIKHSKSKKPRQNKCAICEAVFKNLATLSDHQVKDHGGALLFECELCHSRYMRIRHLLKHEKKFHKEEQFKEKGKSSTKYMEILRSSTREETLKTLVKSPGEVYKCPICSAKSFTTLNYNKHVQNVHVTAVTCEHCGLFGGTRSELKMHIKSAHASEHHICPHCGKSWGTADQLRFCIRRHKNHEKFTCEICGKKFNMSGHVKRHKEQVHTERNGGERSMASKVVPCPNCDVKFSDKYGLRKHHKKFHTSIALNLPSKKLHTGGNANAVACPNCDAKFARRSGLITHLKKVHPLIALTYPSRKKAPDQKGLSPEDLTCKVCGKICKFSSVLTTHMKTAHSNERPFECDVCGKGFKFRNHLNDHKNAVHMNTPGNVCDICGVHLELKDVRLHKMNVHGLGLKCEVCGKMFSFIRLLKQHAAVHLSEHEKQFRCEVCGKGFSHKQQLQVHHKRHYK